jgi:hypothetical protein
MKEPFSRKKEEALSQEGRGFSKGFSRDASCARSAADQRVFAARFGSHEALGELGFGIRASYAR